MMTNTNRAAQVALVTRLANMMTLRGTATVTELTHVVDVSGLFDTAKALEQLTQAGLTAWAQGSVIRVAL